MVLWWLLVDLPNILAVTDRLETWLVPIERSFQGLSVAIETVRIDGELMEIWLNEVCDSMVYHYTKRVTLARLLANEGPAICVVHLNRYFVIPLWYYLVVTFCDKQELLDYVLLSIYEWLVRIGLVTKMTHQVIVY